MSLGHKWKSTLGWELWALSGKEMTLGQKWKPNLGPKALGSKWKINDFGS